MRIRSSTSSESGSSSPEVADSTLGTTSQTTALRTLILVAFATAVGAAVISWLRSRSEREVDASIETVRNRTAAAVPTPVEERVSAVVPSDPRHISIGDSDAESTDSGSGVDTDPESSSETANGSRPVDDAETTVDLADDRSPEEITEQTTDDVQADPAEPGEMAVDEDVEELVDEQGDTEAEETDADEETDAGEE